MVMAYCQILGEVHQKHCMWQLHIGFLLLQPGQNLTFLGSNLSILNNNRNLHFQPKAAFFLPHAAFRTCKKKKREYVNGFILGVTEKQNSRDFHSISNIYSAFFLIPSLMHCYYFLKSKNITQNNCQELEQFFALFFTFSLNSFRAKHVCFMKMHEELGVLSGSDHKYESELIEKQKP